MPRVWARDRRNAGKYIVVFGRRRCPARRISPDRDEREEREGRIRRILADQSTRPTSISIVFNYAVSSSSNEEPVLLFFFFSKVSFAWFNCRLRVTFVLAIWNSLLLVEYIFTRVEVWQRSDRRADCYTSNVGSWCVPLITGPSLVGVKGTDYAARAEFLSSPAVPLNFDYAFFSRRILGRAMKGRFFRI